MREAFGLLAGIVGIAGYIPYVRDILRRQTRPDRATWLIWIVEYSGLFLAQIMRGARASLWLVGLQWLATLTVWILSIPCGHGRFGRHERILLAGVCIALLAWFFTKSAGAAILLLVAVEAAGVLPTVIKTYRHPGSETLTMWALLCAAGALGTVAVGANAAGILYVYPVALIFINGSVIAAARLGVQAQKRRAAHDTPLQPDDA